MYYIVVFTRERSERKARYGLKKNACKNMHFFEKIKKKCLASRSLRSLENYRYTFLHEPPPLAFSAEICQKISVRARNFLHPPPLVSEKISVSQGGGSYYGGSRYIEPFCSLQNKLACTNRL